MGSGSAGAEDRFRVRERYLPLVLSYPQYELLHMVHARPLLCIVVGRDRYSPFELSYPMGTRGVHAALLVGHAHLG